MTHRRHLAEVCPTTGVCSHPEGSLVESEFVSPPPRPMPVLAAAVEPKDLAPKAHRDGGSGKAAEEGHDLVTNGYGDATSNSQQQNTADACDNSDSLSSVSVGTGASCGSSEGAPNSFPPGSDTVISFTFSPCSSQSKLMCPISPRILMR